jgi:hypothetical protein
MPMQLKKAPSGAFFAEVPIVLAISNRRIRFSD